MNNNEMLGSQIPQIVAKITEVIRTRSDKKALWANMQSIIAIREAYQKIKVGKYNLFIKTVFVSLLDSPYFVLRWALHKLTFLFISKFTFFKY